MIFTPLDDRVSFPVCDQQMTTLFRDDCDSHGILSTIFKPDSRQQRWSICLFQTSGTSRSAFMRLN
jgi:hypothetical protein